MPPEVDPSTAGAEQEPGPGERAVSKRPRCDEAPLVLVVDDDPTTRMVACASLTKAGLRAEEVTDGHAALAYLDTRVPDLIMLDVTMPGIDGFTTCCRIRRREACASLPILMVTGLEDMASIEQAYTSGATDFATKPINWALLPHRVRYLLRAAEVRTRLEHAVCGIAKGRRMLDEAERLAAMGSWEWDQDGGRMRWSPGLIRLWGREPASGGEALEAMLAGVSSDDVGKLRDAIALARAQGEPADVVHWIMRGDGGVRCVQHRIEPVADGERVNLRGTLQDITERRLAEEKVRRLAYFDSLTGLPNREAFKDRLGAEVARARRLGTTLGTLFLDLDEFKRINDTLGHAAGDQLLCQVAMRLQDSVRASDVVTRDSGSRGDGSVARLGGDEFTLMLSDLRAPEDAARVAERILALLARPVTVAGHDVVVSPSIGIALYPGDGQDAQALLECADTAMYFAKRSGKNVYRFYEASMSEAARRRLSMEHRLRVAIEEGELALHYQPQMDVASGRIEAVEALLRWSSPEFGQVSPVEFIPLAEETRLIVPIGQWVLETACGQLRAWLDAGVGITRVAVNISPVQFMQPEFVDLVARVIRDAGLPEGSLELEITENLLARDVDLAVEILNQLKALGVQLSIDDFGTGYSSLSQLKRFPVDRLKIDQSFVREVASDADDAAIAMAVIGMAGSMALGVVAEGVENDAQLDFLRARSCDEIQGFLLSHALPPVELEALLRERREAVPPGPALKAVR